MNRRILIALAALALPVAGLAASPELKIPDFGALHDRATDSVDITLDGFLLNIAKKIADKSEDEDLKILADIKSVRVRNFEFDSDGAYSNSDIEAVRRQLNAPGWSALVQAHKREPKEDVDVYLCTEDGKILGIAVIASDPRSFTIVNVIGNIDIDKLAKLKGQFGIPKLDVEK